MGKYRLEETDLTHLIRISEVAAKKAGHTIERVTNQTIAEHRSDDVTEETARELEREAKQAARIAAKAGEKIVTHSAAKVVEWGRGLGEKIWDAEH